MLLTIFLINLKVRGIQYWMQYRVFKITLHFISYAYSNILINLCLPQHLLLFTFVLYIYTSKDREMVFPIL